MNLQSDSQADARSAAPRLFPARSIPNADAATALAKRLAVIAPFEFRSLPGEHSFACDAASNSWPEREIKVEAIQEASRHVWQDSNDGRVADLIKQARQEGVEEGEARVRRDTRAELQKELQQSIDAERLRISQEVRQFSVARDRYFADVELEVVKLVLAIAARVLHREATIDPLLLNGVVRVALEKMTDRTSVVLRVAAGDVEAWTRLFESTEPSDRPRVTADTSLARGACLLDTSMGTVELGIRVQLEEIEKGFFDLLNHRPAQ